VSNKFKGVFKFHNVIFPIFEKKITIENQCWLATDVFVAPGITIKEGTVVGSRSIIYKDLPANKVCIGNPAKIIRERLSELQKKYS